MERLKHFSLGALMIALAALTACSSEDNIVNDQPANPTEPTTYTMTIQASKATGDAAATRGLSLDGKTLNVKWNECETVYVLQQDKNNTADWYYVGKLTAAASSNATTTLSGTLTLEIGKAGAYLDTDAPALRFVLHGNALGSSNESDYSTGQNGLLTGTGSIEEKYDFASCDVAKTSYTIDTEAKTVSVTGGITLVSEQAIVKFSLYQADGTTPINATSLAITSTGDMKKGRAYGSDATTIITQSVSLTSLEGSTNNLYVALCNYNATAYTLTATDAAGNTYTYGPKTTTFTNGKYYEVKVKMTAATGITNPEVGQIIGSDGKNYNAGVTLPSGVTAVAMIAYVGSDAETSTTYNHGLALALEDVSGSKAWCSQTSATCLTNQYSDESDAKRDMAGIANTDALCSHATHTHAAAKAARDYSVTRPAGTSAWFLPSAGQWDKMATAAGGYADLKTNADL